MKSIYYVLLLALSFTFVSCDTTPIVEPIPDMEFVQLEQITTDNGYLGVAIITDCDNIPEEVMGVLMKFYHNGSYMNSGFIISDNCARRTFGYSRFEPGDTFTVKIDGVEERYQETIVLQ